LDVSIERADEPYMLSVSCEQEGGRPALQFPKRRSHTRSAHVFVSISISRKLRIRMPFLTVNGVQLFYEEMGSTGPPVVFVHGSWANHENWDAVAPQFADRYRVVTYDRRGHSQSDAPPGQGSVHEDVDDLTGLIEALDLAPAHVIANSGGSNIALRATAARPDLVRSLTIHEPPTLALLEGEDRFSEQLATAEENIGLAVEKIAAGDHEGGARFFVEHVSLSPGSWEQLPDQFRQMLIENAPTFLDEEQDPDDAALPMAEIQQIDRPVLMTQGDQSAPFFGGVVTKLQDALPHAQTQLFEGEGHLPHNTNPDAYAATVIEFLDQVEQAADTE
jgi:pimeloyl-ACP methyl ester carboxylesterase